MRRENERLSTVILRRMLFSIVIALCISLLALMTTGCGTPIERSGEANPIPASLKQPCPDLTEMEGLLGEVLLNKIIEIAEQYYDCQDGKQKLIDAVNKKR